MALVSYGFSDASDSEDDGTDVSSNTSIPVQPKPVEVQPKVQARPVDNEPKQEEDESHNLCAVLPTPKTKYALIDSDLSKKLLLNKNLGSKTFKKSVQITIPSLSEFEEDLPRPTTKRVVASTKKSGLFDILPPPKNATSATTNRLIPDSVKKGATQPNKPINGAEPGSATNRLIPDSVKKAMVQPNKPLIASKQQYKPVAIIAPLVNDTNDDSDSDEGPVDFLGLSSKPDLDIHMAPPLIEEVPPQSEPLPPPPSVIDITETEEAHSIPSSENYIPFNQSGLDLDEEALRRLCGGSKRKRNAIPSELIDVAASDLELDKQEWLKAHMKEEKVTKSHSRRRDDGPSNQQKRKHQITYLAHQAKEMEQELQNQWASNRMTKKQTQSKYGF